MYYYYILLYFIIIYYNLWHPSLLADTFLDFKSNKEDPYLSISLFSMVLPFSKIQYILFDKYLILTMTIPIPSIKEFQLLYLNHIQFQYISILILTSFPLFSWNLKFLISLFLYITTRTYYKWKVLQCMLSKWIPNILSSTKFISNTNSNPIREASMFLNSQRHKCKIFFSLSEYSFLTPLQFYHAWLYLTTPPRKIFA